MAKVQRTEQVIIFIREAVEQLLLPALAGGESADIWQGVEPAVGFEPLIPEAHPRPSVAQ